jgi:pantetheine-phosphate adenylyltransferase
MKRALFAGTFDPPTLGHLDLIERGAKLCDELYVAIAVNPAKKSVLCLEDRKEMLQLLTQFLSNVKISSFTGLTVEFAQHHKIDFLVRGLRSATDLERELQLATMNKTISGMETVLLPGNPLYAHISSSLIRELAFNKADLTWLVPAQIVDKVRDSLDSPLA